METKEWMDEWMETTNGSETKGDKKQQKATKTKNDQSMEREHCKYRKRNVFFF